MTHIPTVNIASRQHKANPYPFYALLRDEAPVHKVPLPFGPEGWLVTRYDDAVSVLKDQRFGKDKAIAKTGDRPARLPWIPGFLDALMHNMLDVDEPDHTRLRGLVNKAFTPNMVDKMAGRIQVLASELADTMLTSDRADLISAYATPIPTTIIAEMLGVPVADRHKFGRWSNRVITANRSKWALLAAIPGMWRFLRYVRRLVRAKRHEPGDDLTSALIAAEQQGQRMSDDELVAMIFLLLVAGHETTVNLIGNGVLSLLRHPDQMQRLRNDMSLMESAIEEFLRFESPLDLATERYARQDIELHGTTIPRGSLVFVVIASANRDQRQFHEADVLNIGRHPNKHLSFGLGAHYCLGAPLARLEGRIAITTLLQRTKTIQLDIEDRLLPWRPGVIVRGVERLPIRLQR